MGFEEKAATGVSDREDEKGIGLERHNDSITPKTGNNGITLIPCPSNDPLDPLVSTIYLTYRVTES